MTKDEQNYHISTGLRDCIEDYDFALYRKWRT